jgi:hypothetical protein
MRKSTVALAGMAALLLGATPIHAQQTIKIGLILTYSGQFADAATQVENGIKLYVKRHGDTIAGKKIEFIRKDTGGPGVIPDKTMILGQGEITDDTALRIAGDAALGVVTSYHYDQNHDSKLNKMESPRGPMSIDPETRDVVQNVYFRRVQKAGNDLVNVEFDKAENVKDPVKARMAK